MVQPDARPSFNEWVFPQIIVVVACAGDGRVVFPVVAAAGLDKGETNQALFPVKVLLCRFVVDLVLCKKVGRQIVEAQYSLELDLCSRIRRTSKVRPAEAEVRS